MRHALDDNDGQDGMPFLAVTRQHIVRANTGPSNDGRSNARGIC
jgi:hypothetical protein